MGYTEILTPVSPWDVQEGLGRYHQTLIIFMFTPAHCLNIIFFYMCPHMEKFRKHWNRIVAWAWALELCSQLSWFSLTTWVVLANSLMYLSLSFLICEIGTIAPFSENCCEDEKIMYMIHTAWYIHFWVHTKHSVNGSCNNSPIEPRDVSFRPWSSYSVPGLPPHLRLGFHNEDSCEASLSKYGHNF